MMKRCTLRSLADLRPPLRALLLALSTRRLCARRLLLINQTITHSLHPPQCQRLVHLATTPKLSGGGSSSALSFATASVALPYVRATSTPRLRRAVSVSRSPIVTKLAPLSRYPSQAASAAGVTRAAHGHATRRAQVARSDPPERTLTAAAPPPPRDPISPSPYNAAVPKAPAFSFLNYPYHTRA